MGGMRREENRAEVTAAILASARRQVADKGGGALSMREVARDVGMVSSAVFRYFATKEALLTAMVIESFGRVAQRVSAPGVAGDWRAMAHALRGWALEAPHEFQLIYGTPIPGYQAPPETIPAAASVAGPFLAVAATGAPSPVPEELSDDFAAMTRAVPGSTVESNAAAVAELAQLIGYITLELSGHMVGVVTDVDAHFDWLVGRQVRTLGLDN